MSCLLPMLPASSFCLCFRQISWSLSPSSKIIILDWQSSFLSQAWLSPWVNSSWVWKTTQQPGFSIPSPLLLQWPPFPHYFIHFQQQTIYLTLTDQPRPALPSLTLSPHFRYSYLNFDYLESICLPPFLLHLPHHLLFWHPPKTLRLHGWCPDSLDLPFTALRGSKVN